MAVWPFSNGVFFKGISFSISASMFTAGGRSTLKRPAGRPSIGSRRMSKTLPVTGQPVAGPSGWRLLLRLHPETKATKKQTNKQKKNPTRIRRIGVVRAKRWPTQREREREEDVVDAHGDTQKETTSLTPFFFRRFFPIKCRRRTRFGSQSFFGRWPRRIVSRGSVVCFVVLRLFFIFSDPQSSAKKKQKQNKNRRESSARLLRGAWSVFFFFCDFISLCFFLLLETPLGYRCHYGLSYCSSCFCFSGRFSFTFYFGFQAEMMIDLCCTGFSRRWSFRRLLAFRWPSRLKKKKRK